jgi:hypothetical protein
MPSRPIPTIFIVLAAFAAGWGACRYFNPSAVPSPVAGSSSEEPTKKSAETSVTPPTSVEAIPAHISDEHAPVRAAATPVIPSGPNHVVDPNQNVARGDPSQREAEERLVDQVRDRFPEARMTVRKTNPDGTYVSKENLDDGGTVARSFNAQGQLVGEDWKQAGGDDIIRSYYDGGGIKGFSIKYANGSDTNITFTQSGLFKARSDDYPDGTHVYTNYDDQGQVLERWSKGKDGKSVRIQ